MMIDKAKSNSRRTTKSKLFFSLLTIHHVATGGAYAFSFSPSPSISAVPRSEVSTMRTTTKMMMSPIPIIDLNAGMESITTASTVLSSTLSPLTDMTREQAEQLAGPFFGSSLFPYLAFLYFLDVDENQTPKGVTVGFATCLLFVFLTIPAAIAAQVLYGVSLADSDWLHGSAESLLTITNLVTVVAFRQALQAKEEEQKQASNGGSTNTIQMPLSATSYQPMVVLVVLLTFFAGLTALVPVLLGPEVHTPYFGGFMDLPKDWIFFGNEEPSNALTVGCWIIHVSSLVEFLVAMGFAWRWADIVKNPRWKGLTWGLIPLHSSGITACTYHLFYNSIPVMVPLQAFLTCVGNTTAAYAAYRIAISNGWQTENEMLQFLNGDSDCAEGVKKEKITSSIEIKESESLIGFEDLGDALANDTDYTFLIKLFAGCAVASYGIKYGELLFDFPFDANLILGLSIIFIPSLLNAFKWYKRSLDPTFEGWF